jgi:Arc/MetJ-type ribon-helix-helix transcriptional regulator
MPEGPISVRLDEEAQRALDLLTRDGKPRSEAIRDAVILAARTALLEQVRRETEVIAADEDDRREAAEVLALMESLRDER